MNYFKKSMSLWIARSTAAVYPELVAWAAAAVLSLLLTLTVAAPAAGAATLLLPPGVGLVGAWKFDEGAGTKANDSSGFRNAGTLSGSPLPLWTGGKLGRALSFNGTTSYVDTGRQFVSGSDDFTIGAWVKSAGTQNGYAVPISQGHVSNLTGFAFQVGYPSGNEMSFIYGDSAAWRAVGFGYFPRTDYTWHFLSVTKSGNTITTYRDGAFYATSSAYPLVYGSINFSIGRDTFNTDSNHRAWNGNIDDVRIYNRALSAAEVAALYRSGAATIKAATGTGLVGAWKFDEGAGTRANDSSGLGNTGTLIGSPTWTTGKFGKALSFNGTNLQYVNLGANSITGTSAYTLSAWVKGTGGSGGYGSALAIGNGAVGESAFIGWVTNAQVGTSNSFGGGGYGRNFGSGITDQTKYHHIVLTSSGGSTQTITLYVDGVQTNQNAETFNLASNVRKIGVFDDAGNPNYYWNGSIDDARIYSRALSAAEVAALYRSGAATVNAPTNTSVTNGLVGLWSFDGKDINWGIGTAFDRSGAGNNGSLISMSTTSSPVIGKIGQALKFNGSSYVISTGSSSLNFSGAGSLGAFVKVSAYPAGYSSIYNSNSGNSNPRFELAINSSGRVFYYNSGFNYFTYVVPLNTWVHLSLVVSGVSATLYVNGVANETITAGASFGTGSNSPIIGSTITTAEFFNGSLDDVRIYNRALSATEVKSLYNLGR
ncbi:MAG: LamG domain-containing protein [Candidatus Pacebacteria bacterium]|nr:LamG domain-containing protein [Candidatus Paceibacterota bacterium]